MSEELFGPNYKEVEAVIRRASLLTPDELERLGSAILRSISETGADIENAAWETALFAVGRSGRKATLTTDLYDYGNAYSVTRADTRYVAWYAARNAALATTMADLVGQHGFTQEHMDILMKPWIEVLGTNWKEAVE